MRIPFTSLIRKRRESPVADALRDRRDAPAGSALAEAHGRVIRAFSTPERAEAAPSRDTIERVLAEMRAGNAAARARAARTLGDISLAKKWNSPEVMTPLVVSLRHDEDPTVREESAWALWKQGDARAHKPLLHALLHDPSVPVRERAARALGLMGAWEALPVMTDLLSLERHVPARLRAGIVSAFGFLAREPLLPLLFGAAHDTEPRVRAEAVRALGRFLVGFPRDVSSRAEAFLKRALSPRREPCGAIRQSAIRALRFSAEAWAGRAIAAALVADPDAGTREEAAEVLLLWDDPEVERALLEALEDDVWRVRKAAARSLARFIVRYCVYDGPAVAEALRRLERMLPAHSLEWRLAADAFASL